MGASWKSKLGKSNRGNHNTLSRADKIARSNMRRDEDIARLGAPPKRPSTKKPAVYAATVAAKRTSTLLARPAPRGRRRSNEGVPTSGTGWTWAT